MRASSTVDAGYSDDNTAATSRRPVRAARTRKAFPAASPRPESATTPRRSVAGKRASPVAVAQTSNAGRDAQRAATNGQSTALPLARAMITMNAPKPQPARIGRPRSRARAGADALRATSQTPPNAAANPASFSQPGDPSRRVATITGMAALNTPDTGAASPMRPMASAR